MHTEVAIHSMNAYVWCWRKACGSLDEIPSVTMGTYKRKFLMNSNMTLTVLNLHQQTDPKVQQDFKGQYSKVKGQSVSHHDEIPSVTMGTYKRKFLMNSNMTLTVLKGQSWGFTSRSTARVILGQVHRILTVLNLHQQTDPKVQQDFKGQYSKVKGQSVSHHDVAHLKPSKPMSL